MNSAASPQSVDAAPVARILYDGFISYRHNDQQIAIAYALQRALHGFAKPWYWVRAVRPYRDETNLSARPDLWKAIEAALDASRFLLLMASPEAASSHWVEREDVSRLGPTLGTAAAVACCHVCRGSTFFRAGLR